MLERLCVYVRSLLVGQRLCFGNKNQPENLHIGAKKIYTAPATDAQIWCKLKDRRNPKVFFFNLETQPLA